MKRERVLLTVIGVLLAVSVLSLAWASVILARNMTITSLSIDGYGLVIDSHGNWIGKPTGLQGPPGPQGPTGSQGQQGPGLQGPQGERGPQGIEGPAAKPSEQGAGGNMVVAMGFITKQVTIAQGYNINEVIWDSDYERYVITLKDIDYEVSQYVTVITPTINGMQSGYGSHDNKLWVTIASGERRAKVNFSFVVYQTP